MLCWPSGWYEPLVEPITKDYRICTMPVIDIIDDKTLEYRTANGTVSVGGMNLYIMFFDWEKRQDNASSAIPVP